MSKTLTEAINLNNSDGSNGLIINPFMEFSQQRGTTSTIIANDYTIDQWTAAETSSGVLTMQQFSGLNSAAVGFKRFENSLAVTATTAAASYSAAEFFIPFRQPIEGSFWKILGWGTGDAEDIDVVLVLSATVTGTYVLSFLNGASNRSYVTTFNLIANTPTIIFKTIPGDTSGTWPKDNFIASQLYVGTVGGSNTQTPTLNSWQTGSYTSHSSATNWAATLNANMTLSYANIFPKGILPFNSSTDNGLTDTLFALKNDYDRELMKCKRYWQLVGVNIRGYHNGAGGNIGHSHVFYPTMRVAPTMAYVSGSNSGNVQGLTVQSYTDYSALLQIQVSVAGDGFVYDYRYSANARM